jgi:putative ABC transport system permease protein
MSEFATLKAMGYGTAYFLSMITMEAVFLSFFGFVPGAAASTGLYMLLANSTGLLLKMKLSSMILVLVLTLAMCVLSGLLAVRKLLAADPATLF